MGENGHFVSTTSVTLYSVIPIYNQKGNKTVFSLYIFEIELTNIFWIVALSNNAQSKGQAA